jgi:excisionase family DNA binding protein
MASSKQVEKDELLTIDAVAKLLFVTDRTIRNWLAEKDMPSVTDKGGRRFRWFDVLPWYTAMRAEESGNGRKSTPEQASIDQDEEGEGAWQYKLKLDRANYRRALADADLKELELAERRGQVIAVEDATRSLQEAAKTLQVEILAWPTIMVGQLFGVRDRGQLLGLLTSSARELCTRLATIAPEPAADA